MADTPLYVQQYGNSSGPTIVFLPLALGINGWMWKDQVELLPKYHCVVPDLPGHGKSNYIR